MSLAERLASPPVDPTKRYCTIGALLDELARGHVPGGQRNHDYDMLVDALGNPAWPATRLAGALAEEGHRVNFRHIREHRRREHTSKSCAAFDVGVMTEFSGS